MEKKEPDWNACRFCNFHRLFRRHTGLTVQEYVDRCRLARFRQLTEAGRSQKAISEVLGFSHPASFSRWKRTMAER